jgi:hypothetical protein
MNDTQGLTVALNEVDRLRAQVEALREERDEALRVRDVNNAAMGEAQVKANEWADRALAAERTLEAERGVVIACVRRAEEADVRVAALEAALRECQQQNEDGPCWCCIPSMIPYRGHDAGCEAARAALKGEGEGGT